ncbi:TPA: hypothetical protein H2W85_003849 [Salmonella enterica]|nr:hypothetical protein [Salmonella enterica]
MIDRNNTLNFLNFIRGIKFGAANNCAKYRYTFFGVMLASGVWADGFHQMSNFFQPLPH